VRELKPGPSLEHTLEAGQTQSFTLRLNANQYARVLVEQQNLDVKLKVLANDGKTLIASDNPNSSGLESLTLLALPAGSYQLQIQAADKTAAGRFVVKLDEVRTATAADQDRIEAERLFLEAEQLRQQDQPRALEKYEAALQIRRQLADHFDEAVLWHCLGQLWAANSSPEKAHAAYRQALTLFQSASGQGWDGMFSNLSFLYTIMGSKQKALDYLAEAVPLVRALRNRRLEAVLLVGIAKIHEDLAQQPQALERLHNALQLYRASGGRAGETITLTNIGDADLTLAEKQKAIQYLNQSLLLVRAVGDKSLEATIIFGLAYVYNLLDEKQKALEYYEQALPLFRTLQDRNSEAYVLNFIGSFYYGVGEYQKASDYFEQALPLFRSVKDQNAEAYTLCYLGAANYNLGNQQQALNYQQQALTLFRTAADRYGEAVARSNLSVLYWQRGDKPQAHAQQQQAWQLWRAIGYRSGEAHALNDLGVIAAAEGDWSTALNHHQQALALFRLLGNRTGESYALYGLARLMRTRGNLEEARTHIEAALDIIESLRAQITSPELRASYLSTQQPLYSFHIEILMQLHQQKPRQGFDGAALQASERARGRSLLEILTEAQIDIRQGVDAALLARERQVQKQLNAKEQSRLQLVNRKPTPEQSATMEKELRALTAEYQEIQAQIRARSPRYAALTQPQPLSLKEIQQQVLDEGSLLLEYVLGEERSYLWAVTLTSITSFVLPKRVEIETAARKFYETVTSTELQLGAAKQINQLRETSAQLSQMLLAPVAPQLGNKRLLIVADGALQYIPFAALPEPVVGGRWSVVGKSAVAGGRSSVVGKNQTPTTNHQPPANDQRPPLIVQHEIVSLASASALAVLRRETTGRSAAPKTLALVADPVFSPDDARVTASRTKQSEIDSPAQRERHERLNRAVEQSGVKTSDLRIPRLPGTRREAAAILEFVPASERKQSFDFEANRAAVTSQELAQYRLIHLATHGLLNSTHPELSGLVLSLVDQQGTPQDGFLRLHEIYNLRLPADLVVLSACQTALGKEIRGEGLVGLTRGFMYAGVPRVVASLWKVDDKATAVLMRRFYQAMLQEPRLRPAAALRAAQIELLQTKRTENPYYWAAFVLQGEWK
jgi:CHAT domain-containing protein